MSNKPQLLFQSRPGKPAPLGSTVSSEGVNFSIYAKGAYLVELYLFEGPHAEEPFQIVKLDRNVNRSFYYWHVFLKGAQEGLYYAYRVFGECKKENFTFFDGTKLLTDPFAKGISTALYDRDKCSVFGVDTTKCSARSVVIDGSDYDWSNDIRPRIPLSKSVIYELHVGGFTLDESSGLSPKLRGTYKGLIKKLPYLKKLGVTTIELMPVHAFDEHDAPPGLENYWGYSPISYFAPHMGYACSEDPIEAVREFKDMVKAIHAQGMEVILDVVYNHTAEAGIGGPWQNLKGLSSETYYLKDQEGEFANYTGCGNTINTNNPVVRRLITESLHYWVSEMRVDGFRFDLASVLARGTDGTPLMQPPVLSSIEMDPYLANSKLIAEAWDASGLYMLGVFTGKGEGKRWAEWNGAYRDDIRRFVKGDEGTVPKLAARVLGSPDIYKDTSKDVNQSIHFVSCHDGFTMYDLVSYNQKHNLANGENNRDGLNENYSWNCGIEGPTDDPKVNDLRHRQMKNLMTILALTQGTPMFMMGDEIMRTQQGNNNAYCQNNELSWMDWNLADKNADFLFFVQKLLDFSNGLHLFDLEKLLHVGHHDSEPFILWHGIKLNDTDWSHNSRTISMEMISPKAQEQLYIIYNFYWDTLDFEIPKARYGQWEMVLDTSMDVRSCFKNKKLGRKKKYKTQGFSAVILISSL